MDKIIENSICSCCNEDTNILKVVAGNDINVSIQLSVKENDEYVIYELDDIDEMLMNVVSPTGDKYEVPCFIVGNKISGIIDSNVLESNVPYGIELIWKDGPYDKRAYADDMIMFVNSSIEATDSAYRYDPQSPYEYNIIMENDTCYISIGQIPNVDISNYVTQGELTTSLDALWQDCNSTFVDHEELADAISDLDLSDYVTQTSLNTTLQDYVQTSDLSDYVTQTSLNTTLQDYVQTSALDDYVTQSSLDAMSYVTDTELQTAIAGVTIDETNLVHKTGNESIAGTKTFTTMTISENLAGGAGNLLNSNHQNYVTSKSDMSTSARFVAGEIIAPEVNFNWPGKGQLATAGVIKFSKFNTTNNTTSTIAKIDENGIYEGTTLLENKYLQIADLPSIPTATSDLTNDSGFITSNDIPPIPTATSDLTNDSGFITSNDIPPIPTATSDLTNDSGFITNSDLTTALSPIESDITSLDGRVTTLEQSGSGVSQEDWDNANEAIAQELSDNRLAHININNQFSNYYTKTDSDSRYATQSWANNKFVTQSDDVNRQQAIAAAFSQSQDDIDSLDSRVTTLEQSGGGGTVPSNVVTSDDGNEIVCLTQSEYDTLEQNQQLESDVFYYITDATTDYISQSDLTTTLADYATRQYVNSAISGVTIDETNLVHKTGTETISGVKTFSGECTWLSQSKFGHSMMTNNSSLMSADNAFELYKTGMFVRPQMLNVITGQILAPNANVNYDNANSINNEIGVIKFQSIDSVANASKPNLSLLAKIDSNGIYEGNTLLSNKYAQISSVPTATSDLTNDSGFVSSSSVTNIWQGSQSDYNNISTPDPNTLYIII